MTISFALIAVTQQGATKLPTSVLRPMLVLHANVRLNVADSPPQSFQPRFRPPGPATAGPEVRIRSTQIGSRVFMLASRE